MTFQLDHAQWEELGRKLGVVFTQADQEKITSIVDEYLYWDSTERSAPFCTDEAAEINKLKTEALRLRKALYETQSVAAGNAHVKLSVSFQNKSGTDSKAFESFRRSLLKFIRCCNDEIRGLQEEQGWKDGNAWTVMINKLGRYFKFVGYPAGVRQDSPPSPFVSFVSELHRLLPADAYRGNLALEGALAKAIQRARKAKQLVANDSQS